MSTNKLKKILYVTAVLQKNWPGGEPVIAKNTIESLKSMNYDVRPTLYRSRFGNFMTRLFGLFRAIYPLSDSFILSYLYYKKIIRRENPDMIIAQYDYDSSIIKAALDENKKIIVNTQIWWPTCPKITRFTYDDKICQGFTNSDCKICLFKSIKSTSIIEKLMKYRSLFLTNNRIHKKMKNRIDLLKKDNVTIVALSSRMRDHFVTYGIPEEKIKILPNGASFKGLGSNNIPREKIVCFYGTESEVKGFKIFYQVAEIVKTKYTDIQFVAAGNFKNKSPYVDFVGLLNHGEVEKLMAKSRCTVIPSIWDEPFALVAIESMAVGTPAVAFDVGILKSIIRDGEVGFIVPLMAIDEMVDRIIKIVNDDELFAKLSENGRGLAYEKFTENKRMALLDEIIKELLQ